MTFILREKEKAACDEEGQSDGNKKGERNKAGVPMYM